MPGCGNGERLERRKKSREIAMERDNKAALIRARKSA
jgi:hypothetical protein